MLLSIPLAMLLTVAAPRAEQAAVAPFVGEDVSIVVQLDLTKLDVETFVRRVVGKLADEDEVREGTKVVGDWTSALKSAGAKNLFILIDPADIPGIPVVVVPLSGGTDGKAIAAILSRPGPNTPVRWPATETIRGAVVGSTPAGLARIKNAEPKARPELPDALAAGGDASVRVAIIPSTTQRRAIEESLPTLPPQLGGGPITVFTQGLRWASLTLASEPKPALHAFIQAKDADSAKALQKTALEALNLLAAQIRNDPQLAPLASALAEIKPQVQGDSITLEADLEKTAALVAVPISQSREAARRSQCVNNLKQIGLAMHNYHATFNIFPAAYSKGKDGKPLLSWRVAILPYLEQQALYNEFKLDEPWDSPHNKALITRMPATYACPSGNRALAKQGKTSYLTPRGPATIFPGSEGVKLQEITDGTSNTILVVDANDEAAVTWTKPDDWEVAAGLDPQVLFGHHPRGANFGFADGSVRFLRMTVAPKVLQALITRNGGEVVSSDDF